MPDEKATSSEETSGGQNQSVLWRHEKRLMAHGILCHKRLPVIVNWQEQRAKQAKMAEAVAVWPAKENMQICVSC